YWRHLPPSPRVQGRPGLIHPRDKAGITDLFGAHGPYDWLGRESTATCIDYSVGKRFYERLNGLREGDSGCALGALRWTPGQPSELLLDTGHRVALGPFRP
ncbi:MAG: hypothetical protein QGG40_04700, partial [Myxococcota bacterium]|nr:hypothetical protein [Myxococcota bacterium]